MSWYKISLFAVLFTLIACGGEKIPKDVLEKEQIEHLLLDVHMIDGYLHGKPDSAQQQGLWIYQAVFKKHHTDSNQFKKSMLFYSSRPQILHKLYVSIQEKLQALQDSLVKEEKNPSPLP